MNASPCVGSGYCCWKTPCAEAARAAVRRGKVLREGPCPFLRWDGERHRCGLVMDADEAEAARLTESLAIGAGCCSALNSWRREPLQDRTQWREK